MGASKRARKTASGSTVKEDILLDAGIWGKLQDHISLQNVYEKLPYKELCRLRLICKSWHHAALQRLEPKPYFVIIPHGIDDNYDDTYLNGVLSYDVASKEYSFTRQRFPLRYLDDAPFEVEGLIFCQHPENEQPGVFSIHTKMWHAIPPVPEKSKYREAIGMMVDTSERPYSFKLVVGSLDTKTQIYDSQSRSWSTTSSRLKRLATSALSRCQTITCMCSNGCVYISIGAEMLLMYSIEGDKWTVMDIPEVKQEEGGGGGGAEGAVHALGEWKGRIFTTRENCRKRYIRVWELVDPAKEEWVKSIIISGEDYDNLMECDFSSHGPSVYEDLRLVPCFCDGYLLIYNWHYSNCQSYALGVMNLATNEWESVDLPPQTVAIKINRIEGDSENERGDAECFDIDEEYEEIYGKCSDCDEDAEEDEGSENKASDSGCAASDIRVRRKTGRYKVNFRRLKGTDALRSKIAHHRQIGDHEMQLVALRQVKAESLMIVNEKLHNYDKMDSKCQPLQFVQNQGSGTTLQSDAPAVTSGGTSANLAEELSSTVGKIVMNPTLAAKAADLDWRKSSPSSSREAMMRNLASKTEKPTIERFECDLCLFDSNALRDYEVHMKTKVHKVIEVLCGERNQVRRFPMTLISDYVASKQQKASYEMKPRIAPTGPIEVIAVVEGAANGTRGPPTKGFGFSHRMKRRAQHNAAADALEKIMENVPLDEFINLARKRFNVEKSSRKKRKPKRKDTKRGNTGGIGGSGAVGAGGKLAGIGRSSAVGGGGNIGGIASSSVVPGGHTGGIGSSGAVGAGGNLVGIGSSSAVVAGGNTGGIGSSSAIGVGGDPGGSGGCAGSGVGGGSYPSNPNAIPVTGYNNYSSSAGNVLHNNVEYRHPAQGGTGFNMLLQGGRGGIDRSRSESYDRMRERYDGMQGGRGYGYHRGLPAPLGYGGNGFYPGIQAYGQPLQAWYPMPGNIGQAQYYPTHNFPDLSRSQHDPRNG